MLEEWRTIPVYPIYEASNLGRVRSIDRLAGHNKGGLRRLRGHILQPSLRETGHLRVSLYDGGRARTVYVHRLVLLAFVGPPPEGMEACHNNGEPGDNRLENLRWDTRSANHLDSVQHGTNHESSKSHCPHGHEYSDENTYRTRKGHRSCRTCRKANKLAWDRQHALERSLGGDAGG